MVAVFGLQFQLRPVEHTHRVDHRGDMVVVPCAAAEQLRRIDRAGGVEGRLAGMGGEEIDRLDIELLHIDHPLAAGVVSADAELTAHAGQVDGGVEGFVGLAPFHDRFKTGVRCGTEEFRAEFIERFLGGIDRIDGPLSKPDGSDYLGMICLPHQLWVEIVETGAPDGELDVTAVTATDDVDLQSR